MLLDKNGTLECTSYLALRSVIVILMIVVVMSLLLHADEHFGEEIALQFLPILAVFAHVNFTVETQLSEPMNVSVKSKQKIPPPPPRRRDQRTVGSRGRANCPHASSVPLLSHPDSLAIRAAWNATTSSSETWLDCIHPLEAEGRQIVLDANPPHLDASSPLELQW